MKRIEVLKKNNDDYLIYDRAMAKEFCNKILLILVAVLLAIGFLGGTMGILDLFNKTDINRGVAEFRKVQQEDKRAVLVDVRTVEEYREGHIPGSINIPLDRVSVELQEIGDKSVPIYLYCRSGSRSGRAENIYRTAGFSKVKNIGGIKGYKGRLEQ